MKLSKKARQILAWAGIIFLAGMYVLDLILALIGSPAAMTLLRINLFLTFIIPVLLWILLVLLGKTSWQDDQVRGKASSPDDQVRGKGGKYDDRQ